MTSPIGWSRVSPAAIDIRGPDARRWCNGLFTNNVRDLPVGSWNRSAIVDDRGRIGGFVEVLALADDHFVGVVDGLTTAAFLERFERYLLFDRVELTIDDGLERFAVIGGDDAPPAGRFEARAGGWVWGHRRAVGGSFDWLGPRGGFAPVGPELAADTLDALRVEARIPRFPDDTTDRCLPHELDLRDELLHFEKGCYLGQETIHRVDVMGQVKRRLVRVALPGPVASGAELRVEGAVVGTLSSPVAQPDGTWMGLALVRVPHDGAGTVVAVGDTSAGRVC